MIQVVPVDAFQQTAHRASRRVRGYAPEHTITAYRLAMVQGVDYVEHDLAVTKDGVLICLHDDTLERTSDVARRVSPTGSRRNPAGPAPALDRERLHARRDSQARHGHAGSTGKFMGERIPTWQDAIELVRGKAGLYPELKSPPLYTAAAWTWRSCSSSR